MRNDEQIEKDGEEEPAGAGADGEARVPHETHYSENDSNERHAAGKGGAVLLDEGRDELEPGEGDIRRCRHGRSRGRTGA